jgi:TPR repeat protein
MQKHFLILVALCSLVSLPADIGAQTREHPALEAAKRSALQGDVLQQVHLGDSYRTGKGVAQDYAEALRWYRLAAEQGSAEAQFFVGSAYRLGKGAQPNNTEAVKWYRAAAMQGHALAQLSLAVVYRKGEGAALISQNRSNGPRWRQHRGMCKRR